MSDAKNKSTETTSNGIVIPPMLPKLPSLPQSSPRATPQPLPPVPAPTRMLPQPPPVQPVPPLDAPMTATPAKQPLLQALALPSFDSSASASMIDRLRLAEQELTRLHAAEAEESALEQLAQAETAAAAGDAVEMSTEDLLDDVEGFVDRGLESEAVQALGVHLHDDVESRRPAASAAELALSLVDVTKSYFKGNLEVRVLDGLDLEVPLGSFVALMGPSGSGKSTLLHLIAGLDRPTAGSIRVTGADLGSMSEEQLSHWRARNVGFIFQHYNLLPVLSAAQNVELPLLLRKDLTRKQRMERVTIALRVVGLQDRMDYYPRELSGGQEQRVAIARAIVTDPKILICDEPTGDLDRTSADAVLDLLGLLNRDHGKTIFLVTHDPEAADRATSRRLLSKGKLI